jgi:hypothetical protein
MKLRILTALMGIAPALTANTEIMLSPGVLIVCASIALPGCPSPEAIKGHEQYMLIIRSDNPATVGYQYTVSGIVAGKAVEVTKTIARADSDAGTTTDTVELGGIVKAPVIVVRELGVIAVSVK